MTHRCGSQTPTDPSPHNTHHKHPYLSLLSLSLFLPRAQLFSLHLSNKGLLFLFSPNDVLGAWGVWLEFQCSPQAGICFSSAPNKTTVLGWPLRRYIPECLSNEGSGHDSGPLYHATTLMCNMLSVLWNRMYVWKVETKMINIFRLYCFHRRR